MTFGPRSAMGFFQLPMFAGYRLGPHHVRPCHGLPEPRLGSSASRSSAPSPTSSAPGRVLLCLPACSMRLGLFLHVASAPRRFWLHIGGGVLVGLGVAVPAPSASSCCRPLRAMSRRNSARMAFGICTAAGSAGMFLFAPLSARAHQFDLWLVGQPCLSRHPDASRAADRHIRCAAIRPPASQSATRSTSRRSAKPSRRRSAISSYLLLVHRLLRLRLPGRLHHRAFPGLSRRSRHRTRATR
jgi:hypothetical protein